MPVDLGSRLSHPNDWVEESPGVWVIRVVRRGMPCTIRLFGSEQCVVCGEPLERRPGESDKCNTCFHLVAKYDQGLLRGRKEAALVEAYYQRMGGGV